MKKLLLVLLPFIAVTQDIEQYTKLPTKNVINTYVKAGSCSSPDGTMQMIAALPSSWQYLSDNGYCYPGIPTTSSVTMCFTFTPTTSNVLLNAGFSESCANNSFSNFSLYNSSCNLVSTSLTPSGLTVGNQYTWCVTMQAWGGPDCNGYTTFCPYWQPNPPLGVTLVDLNIDCGIIEWTTIEESNCMYYMVEGSVDGISWEPISENVSCKENTTNYYSVINNNVSNLYYKLTQYDLSGEYSVLSIKYLNCKTEDSEIVEIYSMTGQKMNTTDAGSLLDGLYFILYKNGKVNKLLKL